MNAKEPQPLPVVRNDGKNKTVLKNGRNPPVNVIRQPAPPPPEPPKAKSKQSMTVNRLILGDNL